MIHLRSPIVDEAFEEFPEHVREKMEQLRQLVSQASEQLSVGGAVQESLKWGEPAFQAKKGSTFRLGWKKQTPEVCFL